jgi:CubicO group peptidase (beta-lactamase class C family)
MNCRTIISFPPADNASLAAALGALLFGASICGGALQAQSATEPIWPTKGWQTSSPEEQGMDSKELVKLVDFGTTGSLDSLLVVRHGKIVVEAYYAPYDAGIPHQIYSATKSIVSTLTAIARKDGLLDSPEHRVLDFFDRRSIANVDDRKDAITVQDLLYMTSGIEWKQPLGGWPETMFEMEGSPNWVKFVLDRPMASAPGKVFNYSNGNAHIVSAIITRLTGMSALEYAKAKLFGPLGIKDLFWQHDPQGISYGGGGLYLQPRDMAKLGYLYLHNGAWERQQLLPSDWIDKLIHVTIDPHAPGEPESRYSSFFWVIPDRHVYAALGYHDQLIMVFPELDIVVVTTGRDNHPLREMADSIYSSVKSETALTSDAAGADLLANKILDVGTEKPNTIGATPKTAANISGKVYRFPPNPINLKSLSLILTDPQPRYEMSLYADATESGPGLTGPIGLDGLYRKGEPTYLQELPVRGVSAVKGNWQDDHTFVIDRLILGEGQPATRWTLTFDGEKLNLRTKLESGQEISVDSEVSG